MLLVWLLFVMFPNAKGSDILRERAAMVVLGPFPGKQCLVSFIFIPRKVLAALHRMSYAMLEMIGPRYLYGYFKVRRCLK